MEDGLLGGSSRMGRGRGGEEARGYGFTFLFIKKEVFYNCASDISAGRCTKKTGDVRTSSRKFVMF